MAVTYLDRPKKLLIILGFWFPPEKHKILYFLYRLVQLFIQYTFVFFNMVYIFHVWGNVEEVSEACYLFFTQATLCLKATTFVVNKNRLACLLELMESDIFAAETDVHEKILWEQSQKAWRLFSVFFTLTTVTAAQWTAMPLLIDRGSRRFPIKIWMPVDRTNDLEYCVGYVYQTVAIFVSPVIFITIDFITVSMILYASGQLKIIAEKIQMTKPVLKVEAEQNLIRDNNKLLNECVRQHQTIMRFVLLLEDMFNVSIFFQMSGTVAIICIIGLRITVESPNSMQFVATVNYLVTMLAQLYLYCWCGNDLTDRSEELRDTLYECPWYEQDLRFRRTLWLAMQRMRRPVIFRAGYYIPLSRPTFVSILRCSYSYFAVLKQAKDN